MEMKLEIVGLIAIGKLIRYNRKDLSFYIQKQYSTLCGPELYGALNVLYQFALKSGDFRSSSAAAAPFRKIRDGKGRRTNSIELRTRREN